LRATCFAGSAAAVLDLGDRPVGHRDPPGDRRFHWNGPLPHRSDEGGADVGGSYRTAVHNTRHLLHGKLAEQSRGEEPPLDGRIKLCGGKGGKRTRQDGRG
jgi:hypothetical protein